MNSLKQDPSNFDFCSSYTPSNLKPLSFQRQLENFVSNLPQRQKDVLQKCDDKSLPQEFLVIISSIQISKKGDSDFLENAKRLKEEEIRELFPRISLPPSTTEDNKTPDSKTPNKEDVIKRTRTFSLHLDDLLKGVPDDDHSMPEAKT